MLVPESCHFELPPLHQFSDIGFLKSHRKSLFSFFCYCTSDAGISILKCFCQWYAAVVPICKEMAALIQVWFYQINHYSSWLRELAAWCRCIQRLPSHVGKYIENVAI